MSDTTARDAGEERNWWAVMFATDGSVSTANTPTGNYYLCYQTVYRNGTRYHEAHVQADTEAEATQKARDVLAAHYGAGFTGAHDASPPAEDAVERVAEAIYDASPLLWECDAFGDKISWFVVRHENRSDYPDGRKDAVYRMARAAIAALTQTRGRFIHGSDNTAETNIAALPGDTLEALLGQVPHLRGFDLDRRNGRWYAQLVEEIGPDDEVDDMYGDGPTITDAVKAALAAGEGQGDGV